MEHEFSIVRIDFESFWKIIQKEKLIIIFLIIFFSISGAIYSFSLKEEFVSEGKILPEVSNSGSRIGQFAGLAALAGLDLNNNGVNSDIIRPDLYPDILKSTSFFLSLFKEKIKDKKGEELTFQEIYDRDILDKNPKKEDLVITFPQSDNYLVFNKQTEENINDLKTRIQCVYDKKSGIITISVKMPDPVIAANIAYFSMKYLTEYIVGYRTEKQKKDLVFLEERLMSARIKYYGTQSKKASYSDQIPINMLRLQSADLQRERIESDYKMSSTFYNSLLQKYEEAKFKIQQETPVLKVLEQPTVPNFKKEPQRLLLICISTLIGCFVAIVFLFIKDKNYKKIIIKADEI